MTYLFPPGTSMVWLEATNELETLTRPSLPRNLTPFQWRPASFLPIGWEVAQVTMETSSAHFGP